MSTTATEETLAHPTEQPVESDIESLVIERKFNHPPETVFRAWTDQDALRHWIGPEGFTCADAEMDARIGGSYVFPMISPEGTHHTVRGTIKAFVPNQYICFSWAWDQDDGSTGPVMEVSLAFHKAGHGTRLVLTHSKLPSQKARDGHQKGWLSSLNCLNTYLEG